MSGLDDSAERAVGFDLDGTLLDSVRDIHEALHDTLGRDTALSLDDTRRFVGHGARHLVALALAFAGRSTDDASIDETLARFRARYDEAPVSHTVPFPGVVDVLTRLRAARVKVAVCTNKPAPLARVVVEATLAGLVDVVLGPEDAGALKPDPAMLRAAEASLGAPLCAFIGDSAIDAETAARHGVPFVFVSWGLGARESVAPTAVSVDDAVALARVLDDLFPASHKP